MTFPMLWPCSRSLTDNSMSTSERPGEGRTTRPAGSLRVHTGARLAKPKSHPPASSFPPSAVVSFLFSASYLAPWAYRASLKPHQHARKASSTVKGGTAGMCQPLVGLGHASLLWDTRWGPGSSTSLSCTGCCSLPSYTPYALLHPFLHLKFLFFIFKQPDWVLII